MTNPAVGEVSEATGLLTINRYTDHPVDVPRDLPGVVIIVHGVNDVGVCYQAVEQGLCQGLNERLNRADLAPNKYRFPEPKEPVVPDPDKIYYRLQKDEKTKSPVIPFYWGYRAASDDLAKKLVNGQVVDLRGNRLDRDFAKGGGMFTNATSNIPDMFKGAFNGNLLVRAMDKLAGGDAHPLLSGPERRYMVLAAKRLAALVEALRAVDPNETVTLIAHSQGCLVSLLAQAFLYENSARRADCLILNNPPYGLQEPFLERFWQNGAEQQTTAARVATLVDLVKLVTDAPHRSPPLSELADSKVGRGRVGLAWQPSAGCRPPSTGHTDVPGHVFAERDNRGKVYLYFCPHDMTVGLLNVQGIGTFGVPDSLKTKDGATFGVLSQLGDGFKQRVWTWRRREGSPVSVGASGYTKHVLRLEDELGYDASAFSQLGQKKADVGEIRHINGEPLSPPCVPDLHHGESGRASSSDPHYQGKVGFDPIDAAVAVTNTRLREKTKPYDDPRDARRVPSATEVEARLNADKDADHRTRVLDVTFDASTGETKIRRTETPAEARQRYQDDEKMPNSYHSAIVTNPEHHRWVTAMDVAIGQARALDDPEWRKVFIAIADWRTNIEAAISESKNYSLLPETTRTLVQQTWTYYDQGKFPETSVPSNPPSKVVQQSLNDRKGSQAAVNTGALRTEL